jgi:hypothetical protein
MLFPDKWKQKPGAIIYLWGLDCDPLKDVTTAQDFDKVQMPYLLTNSFRTYTRVLEL